MLRYMTWYRGFAIMMIVLVHCLSRFPELPYYGYWSALLSNSTVLFLFISGFLFEHITNLKKPSYKTFMIGKVKRLILPYLFWLIPGLLYVLLFDNHAEYTGLKYLFYTIFIGVGHGNDAHWYISFIFLVFALFPLWRLLQLNRGGYKYVLIPFLLLTILTNRGEVNWFYQIENLLHYIGIFILGMFVSCHKDKFLLLYKFDWVFFIVYLALAFLQAKYNIYEHQPFLIHLKELTQGHININIIILNKLFLTISLLLFFYRLHLIKDKMPILDSFAKYSFAIYFIHSYVISLLKTIINFIPQLNDSFCIFIAFFILAFGLSYLAIFILSKIKYLNKFIGL